MAAHIAAATLLSPPVLLLGLGGLAFIAWRARHASHASHGGASTGQRSYGERYYRPGERYYRPGERYYRPGERYYRPGERFFSPYRTYWHGRNDPTWRWREEQWRLYRVWDPMWGAAPPAPQAEDLPPPAMPPALPPPPAGMTPPPPEAVSGLYGYGYYSY